MGQARTQLLNQMGAIMSEEEFIEFRAALDRLRSDTLFNPRSLARAQTGTGKHSTVVLVLLNRRLNASM
jgi:hypothetical protein